MAKNRRAKILLVPILAVFYFIGFALCIFSQPRHRKDYKRQPIQSTQNSSPGIEIGVLVPLEEQPLIAHQNKEEA